MNNETARYLVTWRSDGEEFTEAFNLWRDSAQRLRHVRAECDPLADILYWNAPSGSYKPVCMPVEHEVTRRPLAMPDSVQSR